MKITTPYLIAGAAVGAALLYVAANGVKGTAQAVGSASVDAVNGIVSGVVVGIGEGVGVPQTNLTECEKAKAAGDTWGASFACPAGEFLGYLWE